MINLLINILLSIIVWSGTIKQTSSIDAALKSVLVNINRFEYKIISPKHINKSKIKIDSKREIKIEKGYAYLPVLFNSRRKITNGIITLKIKLYKNVAVAAQDIKRNKNITQADYRIIEKEVSSLRGKPLETNGNLNKLRAKRYIKYGTVILQNMVEETPDVKRGTRITAFYRRGIVNISFNATARTSGKIGDVIKIKRDDNKLFKAKIISSNQVRIIE